MASLVLMVSHSVCLSVCLAVRSSVSQSVCSVSVCLQSSLFACPSYGQFVCSSVCLPIHSSVCPTIHLFVLPPVFLTASMSVFLSSDLSICPFISLSVHQADFSSSCPTVCLPGLHRGLLLTVTGDSSCLVILLLRYVQLEYSLIQIHHFTPSYSTICHIQIILKL